MSLEITFKEDAFKQVEDAATAFDKPEFRKFNMRFNNLDLAIIDAIAKRDGVSRSQIINNFIERTLKDFLKSCEDDEAFLLTEYAEFLSRDSVKSNKDFAWHLWLASYYDHPENNFQNRRQSLYHALESGDVDESVKNLKLLLDKNKAKIQQS